jgi:predicted P-loop ATPase
MTVTTRNDVFYQRLIQYGLSKQMATEIHDNFSDIPTFFDDLEKVAAIIATKTTFGIGRPKSQPWKKIFDLILSKLSMGSDYYTALFEAIQEMKFNQSIETIIQKLVNLREMAIIDFENNKKNKNLKSTDIIYQLNLAGKTFRWNLVTDEVEVNGESYTDVIRSEIFTISRDFGIKNISAVEDAYITNAWQNRYHPIKELLEGLPGWDGHDYYSDLTSCFQTPNIHLQEFLRKWMIGTIARLYEDTQNFTLCMSGLQGTGKSNFVKWLCSVLPKYFSSASIDPDNKDSIRRLVTKWICEIAELGAITRRADREALKAYLSMESVTVRKPYGRNDITKPAIASFFGTFNDEGGILNDSTGSRRFVICEVEKIEWEEYKKIPIEKLWVQMLEAYKSGEDWKLSQTQYQMSEQYNRDYFETPNQLEYILLERYKIDPLQPNRYETASDLFNYVLSKDYKYATPRSLSMEISSTLLKLGAKRKITKINGVSTRIYVGVIR